MSPPRGEQLALAALLRALAARRRCWVLSGAGVSCASGLPSYRDRAGHWQAARPVQQAEFLTDAAARRRYWTRSALGWPRFAAAAPNPAHRALAALERAGRLSLLVTQNVDRLHQLAGSRSVLDLHGRLDRVRCLGCGARSARATLQHRLLALNPHLAAALAAAPAAALADGDAAAATGLIEATRVPECTRCGGLLKPDVVFYGGAVPAAAIERAGAALAASDALVVVGSSLQVYSGLRFVRRAQAAGTPCYLINDGLTRAADLFARRCDGDLAQVLCAWAQRVAAG